jgi:hypothetical protein
MKQTAYQLISFIEVAEGPAAESRDRGDPLLTSVRALTVFPENPLHTLSVLNMFITGGTYWWATCKAALFGIRHAKGDILLIHLQPGL